MEESSPENRLAGFLAKYTPQIASLAKEVRTKMRNQLPGAFELVYDGYNALAIGFSPTERASDAIFSIALFPRWVSLFFLQGATLPDPHKLLKGKGKQARHIVITDAIVLDEAPIQALIVQALRTAKLPVDPKRRLGRLIIKSVSPKQRPRRAAGSVNTARRPVKGRGVR
jgi:hypothetical protein